MNGDFDYLDQANVVSPTGLRGLVTNLAQANIKALLRLYEGRLIHCEDVGVTNEGHGARVVLKQVEGILDGRAFIEAELVLEISPRVPYVYLVLEAEPEPLDPDRPGSLQVRRARARLTCDPGERAALRLLKLVWLPNPSVPERFEAVEDRLWWPAVARVGSHPRSLEAANRLGELLGNDSLPLSALLEAARGGRIGWDALIPELLRHGESLWRDEPGRIERLREVIRAGEEANRVASLVGLFNDASGLPKVLTHGERRLYLVLHLKPVESKVLLKDGQSVQTATFPGVPQDGELAVKVKGSPGQFYRATVHLEAPAGAGGSPSGRAGWWTHSSS